MKSALSQQVAEEVRQYTVSHGASIYEAAKALLDVEAGIFTPRAQILFEIMMESAKRPREERPIHFKSSLAFQLRVSTSIDEGHLQDMKVMLEVGSIAIDVTHSLTKEQRLVIEDEAQNILAGNTIWGGR